jgi:hypothetical protein
MKKDARSQQSDVDRCAAAALALLERTRKAGWFDDAEQIDELKREKDFTALRGRPDFDKFVRGLEKNR